MQVCGFAIRECSQQRPCHASALRPGIDFSTRIICVCWRALLWETRADNDKFGIVEAIVVPLLTTISGFCFLGFAMAIWSFFCSRRKLISERKFEASQAEACCFNPTFLLNFKAWVYGRRRCAADLFQKMLRSATRNQPTATRMQFCCDVSANLLALIANAVKTRRFRRTQFVLNFESFRGYLFWSFLKNV